MTDIDLSTDDTEYSDATIGLTDDEWNDLEEGDHVVFRPMRGHPPLGGEIIDGPSYNMVTVDNDDDYPGNSETYGAARNMIYEVVDGPEDYPEPKYP